MAVHRAHSPAVRRPQTQSIYRQAFLAIAKSIGTLPVQVISLGCGGGNKDRMLMEELQRYCLGAHYLPCDISADLVREASLQAKRLPGVQQCSSIVCDLEKSPLLARYLRGLPRAQRIFLFLGILPNMEPGTAAQCLGALLRKGDLLVVSANMVGGIHPHSEIQKILPQYDNPLTRAWLLTFLREMGLPRDAGALNFRLGRSPQWPALMRIEAPYVLKKAAKLRIGRYSFPFEEGKEIMLFSSNRHTPLLAKNFLRKLGLSKIQGWISANGEEGVFVGRKV